MGNDKENPRSALARLAGRSEQADPPKGIELSQTELQDFTFAMGVNGYFKTNGEGWDFIPPSSFDYKFRGQRISFFGPDAFDKFYDRRETDLGKILSSLRQPQVIRAIRKYREVDEDQAVRLAFVLGGIVRYWEDRPQNKIDEAVGYVARMTMLGNKGSVAAITSSMAMYVLSGGSLGEDRQFEGALYRMAEAVAEDPIKPKQTEDLGISQLARILGFWDKTLSARKREFPSLEQYNGAFAGFPTVGAEFHFPMDAERKFPNLWKRLAILNMSQYQPGSYVQLSRNDRGIIEVRMNPSFYPITIANWNYMRLILPELNKAFFTVTFNRKEEDSQDGGGNFNWKNSKDQTLLRNLQMLGMLIYAGVFENVPVSKKSSEINFGEIYLGQTVKINEGRYDFSGNWGGGEGECGQLGIYTGFGDNLPELAYFLSMGLAKPDILESIYMHLGDISTLNDALYLNSDARKWVFRGLQSRIEQDVSLSGAFKAGNKILGLFP